MLDPLTLIRVLTIVQDGGVEVTISYMPQNTGEEAKIVDFFLCDFYQRSTESCTFEIYRQLLPTISGNREMGTATSVDHTSSPSRRSDNMLQSESFLAFHRSCAS